MPPQRFDVVVIGAGVMGSATAYWLSREGRSVALLERFRLGHRRGSSHGRSRIFRLSYPDHRYVEMALEARGLWRDLERESGKALLTTTGGFDLGARITDHAGAMAYAGVFHELMGGKEAKRRFPDVHFAPSVQVLFQPDAGVVAADAAVTLFQRGAEATGATIVSMTPAAAIEADGDEVTVATPRGPLRAEVVVVTAGSWVAGLVAPLGIGVDVRPTRETVAYFKHERLLPTLVEWGEPSIYALPSPRDELKVGEHIAGPTTDPNEEGSVNERSLIRIRAWVSSRFPSATPTEHHSETCLYTNTPDERFILERHGRVVVGSPCSGHGFKFAPLIGRRLAALAAEVF